MRALPGIAVLLGFTFASGCGQKAVSDKGAVPVAKAAGVNKFGTEADARRALKVTLDIWAFGDSYAKFQKDHPELFISDPNRITKRLVKYDIGNARKEGNGYAVLVTFTFAGELGDVTSSGSYTVIKSPEGEWQIFGSAN